MTPILLLLGCAFVLFSALALLHRTRELHHGYYGLLLCGLPWTPSRLLGLLLLADDTMQHGVQAWQTLRHRPVWPDWSPVHRLYVWAAHQLAH